MQHMSYLIFILVSAGLILIPGPNVLLIVANSLKYGMQAGLLTVAGTSTAMVVQLCIVSLGISSVLLIVAAWFQWLRWLGAAYLIYLGIKSFLPQESPDKKLTMISSTHLFSRGFLVSMLNPKTLLFFSAFLPQFVVTSAPALPQLAILSATFLGLAILFDSAYALLSARLQQRMMLASNTMARKISGGILIAAGILVGTDPQGSKY